VTVGITKTELAGVIKFSTRVRRNEVHLKNLSWLHKCLCLQKIVRIKRKSQVKN
jgi:hypothetical protein